MNFFERLREIHANLHPWVKTGLWLVLTGLIGLVAVRPAYHVFKTWRAQSHLAEAQAAMAQGRAADAREKAMAAMGLVPGNFAAMRVLAESFHALKDPRAADLGRVLVVHPESTEADRLTGFRVMAEQAPLAVLGAMWNFIGAERQKSPAFREIFVRRLIEQTHYNEAAMLLQEIAPERTGQARPPELEIPWIQLASMATDGRIWKETQESGRKILEQSPEHGPAVVGHWERFPVAAIQDATAAAARTWMEKAGPESVPAEARMAVAWLQGAVAKPEAREGIINAVIAAESTRAPAALTRWLVGHGMAARALELTPPPEPGPDWVVARAEALGADQKWKEALALLDKLPQGIDPLDLACRRLRAAALAGDTARRNQEWKLCRDLASTDSSRNAFLILADQAMAAGMVEEAQDAMVDAMRLARGRLPLHSRLGPLIQGLAERGRGRDLLDVFGVLVLMEPGNPVVVANYCYWGSLHGVVEPDFAVGRMRELREVLPEAVPVRAVLGLALLANGEVTPAVEATDLPGFDWMTSSPSYRAVRGSALLLAGRTDEAKTLLEGLDWDKLLPRETNFFHRLLGKYLSGPDAVPWLPGLRVRPESDGGVLPVAGRWPPAQTVAAGENQAISLIEQFPVIPEQSMLLFTNSPRPPTPV